MTISYPRNLPTHTGIMSVEMRAVNAVAYSRSPFTYAGQAHAYAGQMWQADINLPPMHEDDAEQWVAWLISLRGQLGTFLFGVPSRATPRGSAEGSPLVAGSGQTGGTLNIDGADADQATFLKAGDYIQLGTGASSTLHKVLVDAATDGSGAASLELWPHMRSSPTNNSSVVISSAKGLFRLASNEQAWSVDHARVYGISFGAMEAI
jgi:hypothetical protein